MSDSVDYKDNTIIQEAMDSRLTCGICRGRYNDPRLLPCLHTYCMSCLQGLESHVLFYRDDGSDTSSLSSMLSHLGNKASAIMCPACGTEVELSKGGLGVFPVDFMAQRILVLDSLNPNSSNLICDLCTDNSKAISRCVECMVNVCGFCVQAHKRQRKTAGHGVISLHEAQRQGTTQIHCPVHCPKHTQEELKFFCETCDQPVCRECCLVEHREHLVEYTEDVAEHHARVIANLISRLQPHMQAIMAGKAASEHLECMIKERGEQVKCEVNHYFDNFIQALQSHRQSLVTQIGQVCDTRSKSLQSQRIQLQQILTDMEHSSRLASQALADSNNKELMSIKPLISQRLCHLNRISYQSTPKGDSTLQFKPKIVSKKVVNGMQVPGIVDTKIADCNKSIAKGDGLHRANLGQLTTITVSLQDAMEQAYHHGADEIMAELLAIEGRTRAYPCKVAENADGSYGVSYTPKQLGAHSLQILVNGHHIRGSPYSVSVKVGWQEHTGIWHCCTFCSSEGNKQATCACGAIMPGGFKGCGHSHQGHPGKWHWSCCAVNARDAECTARRTALSNNNTLAALRSRIPSTSSGSTDHSSRSGDGGPVKFIEKPTLDKRVVSKSKVKTVSL
ncbi:tripartite motif-containing protein 45-like [Strongylocentrotus purpuratus]|uniref:Tripartite motif-containing protein 45 n=1 Tax=Strongylocentrotus purpuratus TaxID=7668 RepID=A0A7M7T4K5_STRPU|nr:tripartite motif-containing protein 45-like [Strongylocentrotus purpuratus]XP_030853453.1 tripartite motif-containing protein 45-like [Strongylocentrotus purpuratus]